MRAAVLRAVRTPLEVEDAQISQPGPHEALVRTTAASACHSDLRFIEESYPYALPAVLGHVNSYCCREGQYCRPQHRGDDVTYGVVEKRG
jgi:S-(hydroxymethyl)glutathione dehydrogenase/alcohol dehydrogenase